jgi:hypothetical protein
MSERKKALLILTGGRGLPDLLVVKYLITHEDIDTIVYITTDIGLPASVYITNFIRNTYKKEVQVLGTVDAYEENNIKERCEEALKIDLDAEWIIHSTSAPKVIGIYGHDIARKYGIPYWILDTHGRQVWSLIKGSNVKDENLFTVSCKEYMAAYGRNCVTAKGDPYQNRIYTMFPVAQIMVDHLQETLIFIRGLRKEQDANDKPLPSLVRKVEIEALPLVQILADKYEIFSSSCPLQEVNEIECTFINKETLDFFKGDWLELYVWKMVKDANFVDDCFWGQKIIVDQKIEKTLPTNEIDVALTYQGKLLMAECKTKASKKIFDSEELDKLYSIANLIGGDLVKQVFITIYPEPAKDSKIRESFESFKRQAEVRHIEVVTGDRVHEIVSILRKMLMRTSTTSSTTK